MPYNVFILDEAKREYRSIIDYQAKVLGSSQAAGEFLEEFRAQVDRISADPFIFARSRLPELAARDYRVALVKSYVFLYKVEDQNIFIAHLFHQTQDYARLV